MALSSPVWYQTLIGPLLDKRIGIEQKVCARCGAAKYLSAFRQNSKGYTYRQCEDCRKLEDRQRGRDRMRTIRAS